MLCCSKVIGPPREFQGSGPERADIEPVGTRMGRELIGRGPLFLGTLDPGCSLAVDSVNDIDTSVPGRVALLICFLDGTSPGR